MTVPAGFGGTPYAELTLALPPEWPLSMEAFEDERNYWPVRLLKQLARTPHEFSTFFWYGHTIPHDDPPEPYAENTSLCCALLVPPLTAPEEFDELDLADGRKVAFLGVMAIYEDEMRLKLAKGMDVLAELLDAHGIADVVDPARPSVVG